ncbi:MAG: HAD family hydrolase [Gemmataceae bacterium]|nr:HAD family hydrolase [Gemmataceae bacterium]MDW8266854.1 HAD family hydrolase [Gemmataceae bacterium]
MQRAVFLDRDGVINLAPIRHGKPQSPAGPDDTIILPGVPQALAELRAAGFLLIVATNQPNVAKGLQSRESVEAIHALLRRQLPLDAIKVCYHDDRDGCLCRKPKPGMLLEAAAEFDIDLSRSFMVGDRWRDVAAGHAAGCRSILVAYDYDEPPAQNPDAVVASLSDASRWIRARLAEES